MTPIGTTTLNPRDPNWCTAVPGATHANFRRQRAFLKALFPVALFARNLGRKLAIRFPFAAYAQRDAGRAKSPVLLTGGKMRNRNRAGPYGNNLRK